MKIKNELCLDVESSGLLGPLLTIQYSINRGPIRILRPYKDDLTELHWYLSQPDTGLYAYNAGFDQWKLDQFFGTEPPLAYQGVDLYQRALRSEPLCHWPFIGGKPLIVLKKIHKDYVGAVEEKLKEDLQQFMPKVGDIQIFHKEEGDNDEGEFITLLAKPILSGRLKDLIPLFDPDAEIEKLEESFYLPRHVRLGPKDEVLEVSRTSTKGRGWREDKRVPFVQEKDWGKYKALHMANLRMLADPNESKKAFSYARKDIEYLWTLIDILGVREPDVHDQTTRIVAFTKAVGIPVDLEGIRQDKIELEARKKEIEELIGINPQSFPQRRKLLHNSLRHEHRALLPKEAICSTGSPILKSFLADEMVQPEYIPILKGLIEYKPLCQALKQIEVIELGEGYIYPDFRVVGTFTLRMAGTGGINWQGVSKKASIRKRILFNMSGDFDALEVVLAANWTQDELLLAELREGVDFHTKNTMRLSPEYEQGDFDDLVQLKDDPSDPRHPAFKARRNLMKSFFFGILYGSETQKQAEILGLDEEETERLVREKFFSHYKSLKESREKLREDFCTADFETWAKGSVGGMKGFTENWFGDRRYITFERDVASWLWQHSDDYAMLVPESDERKIVRMQAKGQQKIGQSIRSACLGAASKMQKSVARQMGNYPIQSWGATLTKHLMVRLWNRGYLYPMMNVHDEVNLHAPEEEFPAIKAEVDAFIQEYRDRGIECLSMEFKKVRSWAEK